jgi:hypothetical protein
MTFACFSDSEVVQKILFDFAIARTSLYPFPHFPPVGVLAGSLLDFVA